LEEKDEVAAKALLDEGADPNDVDKYAQNALHMAASKGCSLLLFCRILDMIRDVNAGDYIQTTPLMLASMGNHLEMVVALMKHPEIQLNERDYSDKRTALHHAVYSKNPIIVTQLLSNKETDTGAKDKKHDNTPLQAAIVESASECEAILRKHDAPEEWRSFHDLRKIHPHNSKLWWASTGTRVPKVSKVEVDENKALRLATYRNGDGQPPQLSDVNDFFEENSEPQLPTVEEIVEEILKKILHKVSNEIKLNDPDMTNQQLVREFCRQFREGNEPFSPEGGSLTQDNHKIPKAIFKCGPNEENSDKNSLSRIIRVELHDNLISYQLRQFILKLPCLEILVLTNNDLWGVDSVWLSKLLRGLKSLKELHITQQHIHNDSFGRENGWATLRSAIESLDFLEVLNLSHTLFSAYNVSTALEIIGMLSEMKSLKVLNLSNGCISNLSNGCISNNNYKALVEILYNLNLCVLDVSYNIIDEHAYEEFKQVFISMKTLKCIKVPFRCPYLKDYGFKDCSKYHKGIGACYYCYKKEE
jgi:ankyrin repeat protein